MNAWIVPVLGSLCTILVVSVIYITSNLRYKQRITLIEKGLSPDHFKKEDQAILRQNGLLFIGGGIGFLLAFIIDLVVFDSRNGTEPLYPSLIAICAGLGLLLSMKINHKK